MSIVSAIVLFLVIWFLVLFIVLPIRLETQGERGEVVPGTHSGAPANLSMKRKALITTGVAVLLWVLIAGVILSGVISVRDIDFFNRMGPPSAQDG
jgi:predicted secreted protein